jgi:hypothetical protein
VIDKLQILSKFNLRKDCFNRWRTWIPVRTRSYIVSLGPDARSLVKEIANSTSTVWTTAYHGPDARIADMEIAC